MTHPTPHDPWMAKAGAAGADRRRKLARKWAYLISLTAYVPLPHATIERELLDLVNRVFDAMACEPMPTDLVAEVGARLVDLHCVGKAILRQTLDTLADGLLSDPDHQRFERLPERVVHLLGSLAGGYTDATRSSTMEQQERLHRALLETAWESGRDLKASQARLSEVLASSTDGIAITDLDGRFAQVNAAFGQIIGRRTTDSTELTLFDLVRPADGHELRSTYRDLLTGHHNRLALRLELLRGEDDEAILVSLRVSLLRDADGNPADFVTILAVETDVTRLRARLKSLFLHDAVTGLPNHGYFVARLEQALRAGRPPTVYELELDGFATIIGGFGRQNGDRLLGAVAERLRAAFAETTESVVARFDGATFAVLVESSPAAFDTVSVIRRIDDALQDPIQLGELRVPVSASIGIVHQHSRDDGPHGLINAADLALRRAMGSGRGQWALFDPKRDGHMRTNLASAAAKAIKWDREQRRIRYRPIVRLADEQPLGTEGLVQWDQARHGLIPHERCQEFAEQTGLALRIGAGLLRDACVHAQRQGGLPLHVNLTASQAADRELVVRVAQTLTDTGMPAGQLHLGMPMAQLRADRGSRAHLKALASNGIQVTVHQFDGTPEDLACLADLEIRVVRLSPSLVRCQAGQRDPDSFLATAVAHLIALLHHGGAMVIVDDLTSRTQANWWRAAGADAATGTVFPRTQRAHG